MRNASICIKHDNRSEVWFPHDLVFHINIPNIVLCFHLQFVFLSSKQLCTFYIYGINNLISQA